MAGCAEIAFGIKLNVVESKLVICPSWLLCSTSPLCFLEAQFADYQGEGGYQKLSFSPTAQTFIEILLSIAP